MALSGITVAALTAELNQTITGARISKIAQPEADELLLTIKGSGVATKLLISANASLPFVCLTDENIISPMVAPPFCMLLRKHLQNGKILSVTQPGLERIIRIEIEHLDEMGDLKRKALVIELMGKHSNIIFLDENNIILDSVKRISSLVSSVREVLPGREYFAVQTTEKFDPFTISEADFKNVILCKPMELSKALYTSITGFSPAIASELCHLAGVDADRPACALLEDNAHYADSLFAHFQALMNTIRESHFTPVLYMDENGTPAEFSCVMLTQYADLTAEYFDSVSTLLAVFYSRKNAITRIRQKSVDLRKIIQTILERNTKKYDIFRKQLADTDKMVKYRIYGEMINTYGYGIEPGVKQMTCNNYYTNEDITIPLDPQKTPQENAQKYFEKYNKLKRTKEAVTIQIRETEDEIQHLESIAASIDIAESEADLSQIRDEMVESGYIKKHKSASKDKRSQSKPMHFISSDGIDIYVGKNNYQNDFLTFKMAEGGDWWFHAKKIPGSHVIVCTHGRELPDATCEEAAALAAYYSKGRSMGKVEIDYVLKKEVKKPAGAKPGFVVYYTNYSMVGIADIDHIKPAE